jgi:energy-coupling factor transport system ATP-binding protein
MIEATGLNFRYSNGFQALHDINVVLHRGDFILLTGWNGCGKTTLAKQLNGLLVPYEGTVTVDGEEVIGTPTSVLAERIGFVFQNPDHQLMGATVAEEMAFSLKNFGYNKEEIEQRVRETAKNLDLVDILGSSPQVLTSSEKKLVTVASVLVYEPEVLIIDEATANLDRVHTENIVRVLEQYYREDRIILTISHNIPVWAESRLLNRVVVMDRGRIIDDGPPGKIFTDDRVMDYLMDGVLPVTRIARELSEWGINRNLYSVGLLERKILKGLRGVHE